MIELDEIVKFLRENPTYRNKPEDKNYQISQDFYKKNIPRQSSTRKAKYVERQAPPTLLSPK